MSGLSLLAALKAFDATARAGSMTAAARVLAIQQPTVSSHIQRLEVDFGVELFIGAGGGGLTSLGTHSVGLHPAYLQWRGVRTHCSLLRNQYVGRLVIHAIGPHNVLPVLKLFMKQFPQVNVAVGVGDSRTITERFLTTRETWAWCSITSLTQIYLARLTVPSDW